MLTVQNAGNKLLYEPVFAANSNKGDANFAPPPQAPGAGERRVPETTVQCVAPSYEIVQITPDFGTV